MRKTLLLAILPLLLLFACEDDFTAPAYQKKIVVDGWIEPNQPAMVLLTYSAPYFENIDSASLRQLMLNTAKVVVSSGEDEEILSLGYNDQYFPPYIYKGNTIRGQIGNTYTLTIISYGDTITSTTTIPSKITLDSIWFKPLQGSDTLGTLMVRFSDPAGERNYYRFMTRRIGIDQNWVPAYLANMSDVVFNGQTVDLAILKGNENPLFHEDQIYFERGDTIRFKLSNMDKSTFEFWSSVQKELSKNDNPFSSTIVEIKSNIRGGLGLWAGYGISQYQLIVP